MPGRGGGQFGRGGGRGGRGNNNQQWQGNNNQGGGGNNNQQWQGNNNQGNFNNQGGRGGNNNQGGRGGNNNQGGRGGNKKDQENNVAQLIKGFPKEKALFEVCLHCLKNDYRNPCTKRRNNGCNASGVQFIYCINNESPVTSLLVQESDEVGTLSNGLGNESIKYLISGDKNGAVKKWELHFDAESMKSQIELDTCVDPSGVVFTKPGCSVTCLYNNDEHDLESCIFYAFNRPFYDTTGHTTDVTNIAPSIVNRIEDSNKPLQPLQLSQVCKPYAHRCTVNSIVALPAPFDSTNGRFYSPQYVFTASDDCNIRCWKLMQPEIDVYENFKTYSSHLGPVTGMLLTGRVEEYTNLLATCSLDGTIKLWTLPIVDRDGDDTCYYQTPVQLMERDEYKPLHTDDEYGSHGEIFSASYYERTKVSESLKAHVKNTSPPFTGHKHPILAMDIHEVTYDGPDQVVTFKFLITGDKKGNVVISTLPFLDKVALKSCCTCNSENKNHHQQQQQPWKQNTCDCGISAIRSTRFHSYGQLHHGAPIIIGQINGNISIRRIHVNADGFSKQELLMVIPGKLRYTSRITSIIDIKHPYNRQQDGSYTHRFAVGCDNGKIFVYEIQTDYFMVNNMAAAAAYP